MIRTTARRSLQGALAVLFLTCARVGWRRGTDLIVDSGRTLYAAWRLASGDVLYQDVAHNFGPLSPYLDALVFSAAGVSYGALLAADLALVAACTVMVYKLLERAFGTLAASFATAEFIVVFAFGQAHPTGGYSLLAPYARETLHGLTLCLGMMTGFSEFLASGSPAALTASGLCWGGVFLTKAEYFVAASAAAAAFLAAAPAGVDRRKAVGRLLAAAAAAPLAAAAAFGTALPAARAAEAAAGAWSLLVRRPAMAANSYYLWSVGLDRPGGNAAAAFLGAALAAAAFAALYAAALRLPRWRKDARGLAYLAVAVAAAYVWTAEPGRDARGLPLVALGLLWLHRTGGLEAGGDAPRDRRLAFVWGAFGAALLLKIALFCRLWHYGAFLAMPAAVFVTASLLDELPRRAQRRGGDGRFFRLAAATLLVAGLKPYAVASWTNHGRRVFAVGEGGDRMLDYPPAYDPRPQVVQEVLAWLSARTSPTATMVVMPEGAMLNYLARRRSSIPWTSFLPTDLSGGGEEAVLAALERSPPDLLVLVDRDTRDFGGGPFGSDGYGGRIMGWARGRYREAAAFSAPAGARPFGIRVLRAER